MMLRKMPAQLVPLMLLCPTLSFGGSSDPSNYDECILDAMRGVSSDVAARAIIDSCRSLFPRTQQETAAQTKPSPAPPPGAAERGTAPAAVGAAPAAQAAPSAVPALPDTMQARSLTAAELGQLSAKAKVFGSAYRVTIENGTPNLTLTEVTIAVWDDSDLGATRKEYSEAVQIGPQTSATVKYTVHYRGDETGWKWDVVAARGVE